MGAEKFRSEIRSRFIGESPDDVITMINLIAIEKSVFFKEKEPPQEMYNFGAAIICIAWPFKPPSYVKDMQEFRKRFIGIAKNNDLKDRFTASFNNKLLSAKTVDEAIAAGVDALFTDRGSPTAV